MMLFRCPWHALILHATLEARTGIEIRDAFDDHMEHLHDLATMFEVEFGPDQHFRVWARRLRCNAEMDSKGLGKLGSRLL